MATKTTINISPKVLTGTLTGLGLAAVGGIAAAVTPDTFGFLGVWAPGAFAVATILLGQAAAWFKREQETAAKQEPASSVPVAPEIPTAVEPLVPQTADQIIAGPTA